MTRLSESGISRVGTIIIFIIVALLLAGLVWAGFQFVQQRGEQARRDDAAEIARENLEEQSETPVIADESSEGSTENGTDTTGQGTTAEEEESPASTPTTGTAPEQMPATGPEAVQVIALAALVTSVTYFVVSRKAAREL